MASNPIKPALFDFFRDLARHNNRQWFEKNRVRYERDVKQPLLAFIDAAARPLRSVSPHLQAGPRSLFRLHRDTRFSKDKSPYKTNAGVHFRHDGGESAHALGVYVHFAPGEVFAGGGIWRPDAQALKAIRDRIAENPAQWKRAVGGKAFKEHCRLEGDALKRPPRGYDPEHPFIEDIKRKDFFSLTDFTERQACAPDFIDRVITTTKASSPLLAFLAKANGLPW